MRKAKNITDSNLFKFIFLPLLVGLLSCALWEKIISPLCTTIFSKVSSVLDSAGVTFINSVYKEVGKGFHESSSITILVTMLFLASYFLVMSCFWVRNKIIELEGLPDTKNASTSENNLETLQGKLKSLEKELAYSVTQLKKLKIVWYILAILSVGLNIYLIGKSNYVNLCITQTIGNIEIVSPYISDNEYKQLKSQFYSISSKSDYDTLTLALTSIADANNISLKE